MNTAAEQTQQATEVVEANKDVVIHPTAQVEEPLLKFFKFDHLPTHLQGVSKPFYNLAFTIVATVKRNPERTVALRKLLESKDCAVRANLP